MDFAELDHEQTHAFVARRLTSENFALGSPEFNRFTVRRDIYNTLARLTEREALAAGIGVVLPEYPAYRGSI